MNISTESTHPDAHLQPRGFRLRVQHVERAALTLAGALIAAVYAACLAGIV